MGDPSSQCSRTHFFSTTIAICRTASSPSSCACSRVGGFRVCCKALRCAGGFTTRIAAVQAWSAWACVRASACCALRVHACMCARGCVRACVRACPCMHACKQAFVFVHGCMHSFACVRVRRSACARARAVSISHSQHLRQHAQAASCAGHRQQAGQLHLQLPRGEADEAMQDHSQLAHAAAAVAAPQPMVLLWKEGATSPSGSWGCPNKSTRRKSARAERVVRLIQAKGA